jgi:hypothetical protein
LTAPAPTLVFGVVEGLVDRAILHRLMSHAGVSPATIYVANGKPQIRQRLGGYNNAAQFAPWLVLVDLNAEAECAPELCNTWLPQPAPLMRFRVAVRKAEAWLLADRERLSRFLGVSADLVSRSPEAVADPKRELVDLAVRSRRRAIREDMVPRQGSGRAVGPAYSSRLIEFVSDAKAGWRPEVAAGSADSLRRCLDSLRMFAAP